MAPDVMPPGAAGEVALAEVVVIDRGIAAADGAWCDGMCAGVCGL